MPAYVTTRRALAQRPWEAAEFWEEKSKAASARRKARVANEMLLCEEGSINPNIGTLSGFGLRRHYALSSPALLRSR